MNLSAENISKIRELVRRGYPLKARDTQDLLGHNDHLTELLEARFRLMLSVEIERDQLKTENEALRKKAERYEWLREPHRGYIEVVEWIGPHATGMTGEDLDALLDAAMGKGEKS